MYFSSRIKWPIAISILLICIVGFALLGSSSVTTYAAKSSFKSSTKPTVTSTSSVVNCGSWNIITSPSPGTGGNHLSGIAAISASNIWAVGYYDNNVSAQSLIEHWDGNSWNVVSSPNPGNNNNILYAVTKVSGTNQIWAVGVYTGNGPNQTLIEHYDGSSWSVVSSRYAGLQENILFGVAAVSTNDVWAVGNYYNTGNGPTLSLIEHWDGTSWSVVSNPNPGVQYNYLEGITAISAHNVWAVGEQISSNIGQTLTEHWNGTRWKLVASPNVGSNGSNLQGVAQVPGTHQVWAVGIYVTANTEVRQTLIEHWNGANWSIVSSSNIGSYHNNLNSVVAVSANNAWAVGDVYNSNDNYNHQTLTEHWDGNSWNVVSSPNPGTINILSEVGRVPGTSQIWAVGYDTDSTGTSQTLIEFYC